MNLPMRSSPTGRHSGTGALFALTGVFYLSFPRLSEESGVWRGSSSPGSLGRAANLDLVLKGESQVSDEGFE
jgi:hypothetical protein